VTGLDERAWALMIREIGDIVHEDPTLAEALLLRYRERVEAEDAQ
jgi:hypothetical protein